MNCLQPMLGKTIELKITENVNRSGVLIDYGDDIVVIYDGNDYLYVPAAHIQTIQLTTLPQAIIGYKVTDVVNEISLEEILKKSFGIFLQIYVSGNQSIHGYITHVQSNYFVFYSPIHKTMYIPMFHLKWLIPYPDNPMPYMINSVLPETSPGNQLNDTFEGQLKELEGHLVVFDWGSNSSKIGMLKSVNQHMAELITADQTSVFRNIQHVKTACFPNL